MTARVVIIVPSQGESARQFLNVAKALKREVYNQKGLMTIVQTTVDASLHVEFKTKRGTFSWDTSHNLLRVLILSHGGRYDGPNLAYNAGGYQPWGSVDGKGTELNPQAKAFWQTVGTAMHSDGKIIFLSCGTGARAYGQLVAATTGKRVFASKGPIGAGDEPTALAHVQEIEAGSLILPMQAF